jgi:hypothetical protein
VTLRAPQTDWKRTSDGDRTGEVAPKKIAAANFEQKLMVTRVCTYLLRGAIWLVWNTPLTSMKVNLLRPLLRREAASDWKAFKARHTTSTNFISPEIGSELRKNMKKSPRMTQICLGTKKLRSPRRDSNTTVDII